MTCIIAAMIDASIDPVIVLEYLSALVFCKPSPYRSGTECNNNLVNLDTVMFDRVDVINKQKICNHSLAAIEASCMTFLNGISEGSAVTPMGV